MRKAILVFLSFISCIYLSESYQVKTVYGNQLEDDKLLLGLGSFSSRFRGSRKKRFSDSIIPTESGDDGRTKRQVQSRGRSTKTPEEPWIATVDIETRPKSPAVYFHWSPRYRTPMPLRDREWVYCPNETFVSGVSVMFNYEHQKEMGPHMIRMRCSTLAGDHYSDIYHGYGYKGTYKSLNFCKSQVALALKVDVYDDDCHPGVIALDVCDNLKKRRRRRRGVTDKLWSPTTLPCPKLTAVCGFNVRTDSATIEQINPMYTPCPNEKNQYAPMKSYGQVGMACCRVNNPAEHCGARGTWLRLLSCRGNITCTYISKTGFTYVTSSSQTETEQQAMYDATGFDIGGQLYFFKATVGAQFGNTIVHGKFMYKILDTIKVSATVVTIGLENCDGDLVQLTISCGIYEAHADVYKCLPRNANTNIF